MSSGGLSKARLARLHDAMAAHVASGAVPGVVAGVSRRGEVHVDAVGAKALGGGEPMQRDTIFRIASMTKPVTAVAAMILVEECKLRLDEPVDRLLPELADRRVLKRVDGPLDDTVPAHRAITLRDLLTFRLGIGLLMAPPEGHPILQAMIERDVAVGPVLSRAPSPDAWIRELGVLPLMYQPGERWLYHTGSEVLGVLIARAAGKPLEAFFRERIFEPLGMKDTGFSVPAAKLGRLASAYTSNAKTGAVEVFDDPRDSYWSRPPGFPAGGGGLVSTVDDYLTFGQMLLDKGRHGRERILSRPSVEAMTADQITPEQKALSPFGNDFWGTRGWGLGVAVITKRDAPWTTPGRFGWDGGYGTSWASDPAEELVGVLLTQRLWSSPQPPEVYLDFWTTAYQAIDD
jgi:CubicO group peptidase (beta-lactamase class C family)